MKMSELKKMINESIVNNLNEEEQNMSLGPNTTEEEESELAYDDLAEVCAEGLHYFEEMKEILRTRAYIQEHKKEFEIFFKNVDIIIEKIEEMWYGQN